MCGLAGVLCTKEFKGLASLVESLLYEAASRGTDATGIAYNTRNALTIYKKPVSAYKFDVELPTDTRTVIGHTRHTTQGNQSLNYNNHPFYGRCGNTRFAFAHNGVLVNDKALKKELLKTKIETDSYMAVQLLEQSDKLNFDSISQMAEKVRGSFSFSILDDKNNLYLVKGDSPLSVLYFKRYGVYVYASTDEILWKGIVDSVLFAELKNNRYEKVKLSEGDILKIFSNGELEYGHFKFTDDFAYGCDWRSYSSTGWDYSLYDDVYDNAYYDDLLSVASGMGISSADIDELLAYGLTYDEIEDYLYCKEEV
jgi:glucosamine 6-phosphate synthetase-like amidotransferase/phosphosugar isomerase protein